MKKFCSVGMTGILFVLIMITSLHQDVTSIAKTDYNYAEALQKSIYFYDANKCGHGITGGRLEWRGDCHVEDAAIPLDTTHTNLSQSFINAYRHVLDADGNGTMDLSGGYHDAGDHVRFGLPQGYAASTLGWGYYEFKEAFTKTNQDQHMLEVLKWFTDCFLRSTFVDESGNVIAYCYMVGEGNDDHSYWGPPELQLVSKYPRPADFATSETPASDQAAQASAALTLMYLNYKDIDPIYANECLDKGKALYTFARKHRGLGNGDGFYGSGYDEDELAWAAVWLYTVTGDLTYIRHIDAVDDQGNYTGYMSRIITNTSNTWQNIWVHCWDVVWGGVFTKLAGLFPDNSQFDYFSRWNLEYWTGGAVPHEDPTDTNYLYKTPHGYAMINTWGSARYNTAAQLCTLVYQKYHPEATDLTDWAKGQMDYLLGDNPMGYAYVVGFTDKHAQHPHHRAAHGSKTNSMLQPENHKHTLWGALVGGPDANDYHKDDITDYAYNEVAIDYNAAFVGALAGHYLLYEQNDVPLSQFPILEPSVDEYYAEAKLEQDNNQRTQITITIHNETVHPPRLENDMACRYYFNIKELLDAGQTIDDVQFQIMYDEQSSLGGETTCTGPIKADDGGTYYMEFKWKDQQIYGDRDIHFALVAKQDAAWTTHWDSSNDWSMTDVTSTPKKTAYIPVYVHGQLVYGHVSEPVPPYHQ
ncbi:glycoside hydrolase family 9 protein [Vallitalea pronyensis]|uniref:Glycoside hydrolase family 9 protein n=1 Tax=Vallitalea pronyensis TaxID=1348613 RepID=A0A8J8MPA3_9FIRM|nr:glycoside hydrolase family 9 protein [Vallitalea pronyensis]